ncbi:ABC transporter ATP-binding protein [Paracoccus methylovorus]|uniref:ABC transporter ATP-binding protein n=3 Tax=Paracoccus TaxID=265 RepID=A0ABX7JDU3_9RHOB|nr:MULTISPECIES: ABC transporter ATP-binding protein [Paracoccus]QRZ12375.1 ABC transporter ATP-binding protein [Paracoccus methylovorus]
MIVLENLTKVYRLKGRETRVADRIDAVFPTGASVGLLGRNGAGKSTLLRMIAGTVSPTSGRVLSDGTISWPVGFAGSFHGELTGAQNVRFVARIYGVDTAELVDYVEDFAELGQHYHQPFGSYSSGMRSRLAMGTSMGIHFDTYLVDEVTSVGDANFRAKSQRVFAERMARSSAVVVSHSMGMIRKMCNMGAVLDRGNLYTFENIEDAIKMHEYILKVPEGGASQADGPVEGEQQALSTS